MLYPKDYDAFYEAIYKILKDPELEEKMGIVSKKVIEQDSLMKI